jgi:hypothetical protein
MAKRKRVRSRARRFYGKFRKRSNTKIPFEMLIGAGTIPFTAPADGWNSPLNLAQTGDYEGLMHTLKLGFLGMGVNGSVNFMSLLNPFDMNSARYTKTLLYAALIGKARKRFVPQSSKLISKIPLVGRWVN